MHLNNRTVHETTNNYYYGGTFYEKNSDGYSVVAPTARSVVEHLPEGAEEVSMGDQKYVKKAILTIKPFSKMDKICMN